MPTSSARKRFRSEPLERRTLLAGTPVPISSFTETSYQSADLAPFDLSTNDVQAGGTISVTLKAVNAIQVSCSDAIDTDVLLDGAPVAPADDGTVVLYPYANPIPAPDDGPVVNVPAGSHVVTFTIEPDAPTEGITSQTYFQGEDVYDSGPWVTGAYSNGTYSSAQPFQIEGTTHTLSFTQGPSDVAVDAPIVPPVTVALQTNGVTDPTATAPVTVALTAADGATLGGATTLTPVNGVATFGNLTVNQPGTYTLTASDPNDASLLSDTFAVSAGKLVFTTAPADGTAGEPLKPAVVVTLEDAAGQVVTDDSTSVVTLAPIGVTGAAPITGNAVTLVKGVATFPALALTKPGFYQLQATDGGDALATSGTFKVAGDKLAFVRQPEAGDVKTPLPLSVEIEDTNGKRVTDATTTVGLTLNKVSGGFGAALSGTVTAAFVNGLATFTAAAGPMVDVAGTYTLTATEEDATTGVLAPTNTTTPVTSNPFGLAGLHLLVKRQPADADALAAVPLTVAVVDNHGKVDTTEDTAGVQLSLTAVTGGAGATLAGTTAATFVNGLATFTAAAGPKVSGTGTFTLTAVETGAADPATQVTSRTFKVSGYTLVDPDTSRAGSLTAVALGDDLPDNLGGLAGVAVLSDARGKPTPAMDGLPNVQLSLTGGGGSLTGATTATPSTIADHGVNASDYAFPVNITAAGNYGLVVTAVDTPTSTVPAAVIEPLTIHVTVVDPELRLMVTRPVTANQPVGLSAYLASPKHPTDALVTFPAVGYELALTPTGTAVGNLAGEGATQVDKRTIARPMADGGSVPDVTIDAPGAYVVTATELTSAPDRSGATDAPFAAASAVPVAGRSTVTTSILVLPDHLVFTVPPPAALAVGQAFSVAVAVEDAKGDVLTDVTADDPLGPAATLGGTFVAKGGSTTLQGVVPTPFVDGVATFTGLSFTAPGLFVLKAREQNDYGGSTYVDPPSEITATTNPFKVAPT